MTTLLCLFYAALCIIGFKILRIPATKWTLTTAVLGGAVLVGGILILMNYNHPFSSRMRLYFYATPVSPAVNGQVAEVPVESNTYVKKGEVLFRLDPRPFQYAVTRREAQLQQARQAVLEQRAALRAAKAATDAARVNRDRTKEIYERHLAANTNNRLTPYSVEQVDELKDVYMASEAALNVATAQLDQAALAASSKVNGVDTSVAQLEAELDRARFELDQSVYRAPTDGYATQIFLHPGMMAVSLPVKPVMTFIHTDRQVFAAGFEQIAMQRLEVGNEAEVSFSGIPGRVFKAKVGKVVPFMAQGQLEPSGTLLSPSMQPVEGQIVVEIVMVDDISGWKLPGGSTAEVAVYSKDWKMLAVIRQILLRMRAWENYLVLDK